MSKRKKILFVVLDGLGDEPIPDFDDRTPLEEAYTPNMDELAEKGVVGLAEVEFEGALPTSEEGHLQLFGYDPGKMGLGRGFFTARGAGLEVRKGDVALRGNLSFVKEGKAVDRRAGRIKTEEAKEFLKALKGEEIEGVRFLLGSALDHRAGIVIRGPGLSSRITDTDPFYANLGTEVRKAEPTDDSPEAEKTSRVLNAFLEKAHRTLKDHPLNRERMEKGLPPANRILTRGASSCVAPVPFKEKWGVEAGCVAGKVLYKEIARVLGMEVAELEGATGGRDTDLEAKFGKAEELLEKYDFVFLHIKAADSLAEDGDYEGKKEFIQRIDGNMSSLKDLKNTLVSVTCDHSTCSLLKRHCDRPCPILVFGAGTDRVKRFSEKECQDGGLGRFRQIKTLSKIMR